MIESYEPPFELQTHLFSSQNSAPIFRASNLNLSPCLLKLQKNLVFSWSWENHTHTHAILLGVNYPQISGSFVLWNHKCEFYRIIIITHASQFFFGM
jgi:hypothetical protein